MALWVCPPDPIHHSSLPLTQTNPLACQKTLNHHKLESALIQPSRKRSWVFLLFHQKIQRTFSQSNLTQSCVSSLTSSLPTGILLVIFMNSLILHIQVILTKLFHHQLSLSQNLLTIYIYPSPAADWQVLHQRMNAQSNCIGRIMISSRSSGTSFGIFLMLWKIFPILPTVILPSLLI